MDLVVGATGSVGGRIALGLGERGRQVRAMVRAGATRPQAAPLAAAGIEVVEGDVTRPASLPAALAGVDTVISTVSGFPAGGPEALRRVDLEGVGAMIEAGERAGARRFIYVSYAGNIEIDSPMHVAKRSNEARLRESTMSAVILRPTCFTEVWLSPMLGFDPAAGRVRIFGTGDTPVSYIAMADVAACAVAVAAGGVADEVLELGGPEALTQHQVVAIFERALGRTLEVERVPLAALEDQYRAAQDPVQKTFAALGLARALGSPIPDARADAARFGVRLHTVEDHARSMSGA